MYVGGKFFFSKNNCIVIKDNDIDHTKLGNKFLKTAFRFTWKASARDLSSRLPGKTDGKMLMLYILAFGLGRLRLS